MITVLSGTLKKKTIVGRLSLLVVGFFLFRTFAGLAHLALVAHVPCAEHGKLVHQEDVDVDRLSRSEQTPLVGLEGEEPTEPHTHNGCALCTEKRDQISEQTIDLLALYALSHRTKAPAAKRLTSSLTRYRVAPKQSPPA